MSYTYEVWKEQYIVRSIVNIIKSGRPMSKEWGIPSFLTTMEGLFQKFMGDECWFIYTKLSTEDQAKARDFIESGGTEICGMIGVPVWEEWHEERLRPTLDKLPPHIEKKVLEGLA